VGTTAGRELAGAAGRAAWLAAGGLAVLGDDPAKASGRNRSTARSRYRTLVPPCVTVGRCAPPCCGIHGQIADGVRAARTVGETVGFPRTATDGPRWGRVPA